MANPNLPPRSGLSLYANLLDPDAKATISKGPVAFKPADTVEENKKPQIDPAALRFQPTKRPQLSQKPKPKASFPKPPIADHVEQRAPPQITQATSNTAGSRPAKTSLADWTGGDDQDVNGFYSGEKRQRGGRKNKKRKEKEERVEAQDWDDIYDVTRPNNYEEYKHSDEKIHEIREWKDRLYAHRMVKQATSEKDSDEEDYKPTMGRQFAPPPNLLSFAPPPIETPPPPPAIKAEDESDSYSPPPPPPPPSASNEPPQPPPETLPAGAISRAPVRYQLPPAPPELPASEAELAKALDDEPDDDDGEPCHAEEDAPRSTRPGQKGFAERLMSKYGWSKGKGLGADGSGMITALSVKVEKRKKKSDAEGGGFRDTGGRGKIIGGKKAANNKDEDVGKFGPMSEVIVLRGMVDGMNLDDEVEGSGDGGLMQEIGDECAEKYGRVERVFIDRHGPTPKVFVKFTSQLSGLRAVNALEGRIFNGNTISARFYDAERFEEGIYDLN